MSFCISPSFFDPPFPFQNNKSEQRLQKCVGFTLIELVVVIAIIAVLLTLFGIRTGTFSFWRDEGFLRRLNETIVFLHRQATIDGSFYRLEFDLENNQYTVGIMQNNNLQATGRSLSLELYEILSPAIGRTHTVAAPPSIPSLSDPVQFPSGLILERVRTPRGEIRRNDLEKAFILFSPRGFSEFAVLNFTLSTGQPVTVAINSFTGIPQIYRDELDFEWNYGARSNARN